MEEDDGRREAAIASAPSLQPNFTANGVSTAQISKFQLRDNKITLKKENVKTLHTGCTGWQQHRLNVLTKEIQNLLAELQELHRRRLKIKAKSKVKDKSKGTLVETEKYNGKDVNAKSKEIMDEKSKTAKDPRITLSIGSMMDPSSFQEDDTLSKKRQKLHWGLDTKERWERKSNM